MRNSTRLVALGSATAALLGTLAIAFASPAKANHVYSPACDIFRQNLITAQTTLNNAQATLAFAQAAENNATVNLNNAASQLVVPTFNLIQAHENNVGIPTAQSAFNTALSNFNVAVNQYVSAFTTRVTLEAEADVNGAIVPYLQSVVSAIDSVFPACVP